MHKFKKHTYKYLSFLFILFLLFNALTVNVYAKQDNSSIVRTGWYEDSYNKWSQTIA